MSRAWRQPLMPEHVVPAPTTGVFLGRNKSGPLTLRLLRPRGTRIVVFSGPYAAQLMSLRAAVSGVAVRIVTNREAAWAPTLRNGSDTRLVPANGPLPPAIQGPGLVIEDRPDEPRPLAEVSDWQCLLDLRNLPEGHDEADAARLSSFGNADVAFFGALSTTLANAAGRVFNLGDAAASLTVVPPHAVAVVARGSVQLVRLEATPGERDALRG
ncbi:hypothetical protein [Nocardioides sp. Soil796]|uniref:hypothetical protein n=1 Tax=Nocardioides sp. Soil796 TaxID=1736412 RepID=UPI00070D871C|nr:hypothetical protein [Nocardioides sp. Soil796]KRF14205.1 hypothetical protein ASH02_07580 [Nocardioides sp. Soil796]